MKIKNKKQKSKIVNQKIEIKNKNKKKWKAKTKNWIKNLNKNENKWKTNMENKKDKNRPSIPNLERTGLIEGFKVLEKNFKKISSLDKNCYNYQIFAVLLVGLLQVCEYYLLECSSLN